MTPEAEKFNGWAAMLGFVAAFGAYATTGQIIPGIFQQLIQMTSSTSQIITEYGKQNIFARETPPQLVENYTNFPKEAEKNNGRWAMVGIISLLVAYVTTGQIIPGIF